MARNRSQIMIAEDHAFVADACRKLLEPEYDVVATVGDGRALVRIAANLKPQLIIIDIGMPLLNGLDAGCQVKQILPSVKLVFLTMNTDPALAAEAIRRGASGYLLKTCAASELILAIRVVLKGMSYLSPAIAKERIDFLLRQDEEFIEALTPFILSRSPHSCQSYLIGGGGFLARVARYRRYTRLTRSANPQRV